MCGDPDVLVLDEPTVGLDPRQVTEIRALIRTLSREKTIVFSSHILSEVQQLCDHVVILDHGEVRLDAAMNDMRHPEQITLRCSMGAAESRVAARLRGLDGAVRVEFQASAAPEQTTALITFHQVEEPERRLFALLSAMNIPILHLSRCEDSLEQIFLNTISG